MTLSALCPAVRCLPRDYRITCPAKTILTMVMVMIMIMVILTMMMMMLMMMVMVMVISRTTQALCNCCTRIIVRIRMIHQTKPMAFCSPHHLNLCASDLLASVPVIPPLIALYNDTLVLQSWYFVAFTVCTLLNNVYSNVCKFLFFVSGHSSCVQW